MLLAATLAAYLAACELPSLKLPVRVQQAAAIADGGSLHLVVEDAEGSRLAIGVSGSLDRPRSEFPVYTQRWWPKFPVPALVIRGGGAEIKLRGAVQAWLAQPNLEQNDRDALVQLDAVLQARAAAR